MKNFIPNLISTSALTIAWFVVILGLSCCGFGLIPEGVVTFLYAIFALVLLFHAEMPPWWGEYRDLALTSGVLICVTAGGLVFVWGQTTCSHSTFGPCVGFSAMLWAIACLAAGFAVGFIFGIPRVDQNQDSANKNGVGTPNTGSQGYALRVNTNLEQVSDWLTKIIVGVGLVQLIKIPAYLHRAADWVAQSFCLLNAPNFVSASSFAASIIVFFSIVGFLAGYLITRLFFAGAFGRADSNTYSQPTSFVPTTTATDSRSRLRNFWAPNGVVNPENEKKLTDWLTANNISLSLASFVNGGKFESQRNQAIQALNIPQENL